MKLALMVLGFVMFASTAMANVVCTTESRGQYFTGRSSTAFQAERIVIAKCQQHPRTNNRECEYNVECVRGGNGGGGGGGNRPPQRSDAQCYLDRYPDICQNSPNNYCREPHKHYQNHGRGEGRIWGCTAGGGRR